MSIEITITVLLIVGLAFMALEAFVPSFGILGLGGVGCFIAALVMLAHAGSYYGLSINMPLIISLGIAGIAVLGASFYFARRALKTPMSAGAETMIGKEVRILSWQEGKGRVIFQGEEWSAKSEDDFTAYELGVVERIEHLTLHIKKEA